MVGQSKPWFVCGQQSSKSLTVALMRRGAANLTVLRRGSCIGAFGCLTRPLSCSLLLDKSAVIGETRLHISQSSPSPLTVDLAVSAISRALIVQWLAATGRAEQLGLHFARGSMV